MRAPQKYLENDYRMSPSKLPRNRIEGLKCVGQPSGYYIVAHVQAAVVLGIHAVEESAVVKAAMDLMDVEYPVPVLSAANAYIGKGNKVEVVPVEEADEKSAQGDKADAKAEAPAEEEAGVDCSPCHGDTHKPGEENPHGY